MSEDSSVQKLFDKVDTRLEEGEVINLLVNGRAPGHGVDLRHFSNLLYPFGYYSDSMKITDVYIAQNILRGELGFSSQDKPGDFDILIIPSSNGKMLYDRTCVYEVKVVRPTRKKPSRNANSMGVTQVLGLVDDGFPLVGLIHVCMTEPLKENEKMSTKYSTHKANSPEPPKVSFEDSLIDVKVDHFSWWSADNQIKRLLAFDIPKYVGVSAIGLNVKEDGGFSYSSCSQEFWGFESGYFNPHRKDETLQRLKDHFDKYVGKYTHIKLNQAINEPDFP
ncbi:MAG: hypothetical protein JJ975_11860 [Bacteroidia bacterium]|nr:hypothetical protein [Bacteroidia bacterium]